MDVVPIDPTNAADLAQRLLSLQHAACAVEAALIGDDRIPPLHETIEELRALPLRWLAACDHGGRLVGAVAWVEDADVLDIEPADGRRSRIVTVSGASSSRRCCLTPAPAARLCRPVARTRRPAGCTSALGSTSWARPRSSPASGSPASRTSRRPHESAARVGLTNARGAGRSPRAGAERDESHRQRSTRSGSAHLAGSPVADPGCRPPPARR